VFSPRPIQRRGPEALCAERVGRITSKIGKKAGVKVLTDQRTGKVKHASAHDLRRSFGERWAVRVMPQVLMQLMRHESIDTTLRYYVGRNAETTSEALYQAMGNTLGNTGASETTEKPVDGGFAVQRPFERSLQTRGGNRAKYETRTR
jgi:integrase